MSKKTINEMKSLLSKMDKPKKRRLTVESLITDDEDVYSGEDYGFSHEEEPVEPEHFENNVGNEELDIKGIIKNIRLQVLDGLKKVAEHPETEDYDTLKRILTICDKPAEQIKKQKNEK